jgi:hypothetical protein
MKPVRLAADTTAGAVYVADAELHRVKQFTFAGTFLNGVGGFGSGPGQFNRPLGVAVSGSTLYVADSLNHRIQVFTVPPASPGTPSPTPTATPGGPAATATHTPSPTATHTPTATRTATTTPAVTLSINDVSIVEGNSGTRTLRFTVTRSGPSNQTVQVNYATANGTATGGATCGGGRDYRTRTGTLTFSSGVVTRPVDVPICGDRADEPNETFVVGLSNPVNAAIADGQGTGTITNND